MDDELSQLVLVNEEAVELRRLLTITFRFISNKPPESVRVDVLRTQFALVPAPATR